MEILAVVLVIALVAAAAVIVMQRRAGGGTRVGRPRTSPGGRRLRGGQSSHPMASAVEEKMAASGPAEVVAAEQRLQARARQVAAGLKAESHRVEHQRAADQVGHGAYDAAPDPAAYDAAPDPAAADAAPDPAAADAAPDPRFAPAPDPPYDDRATDPRYDDGR